MPYSVFSGGSNETDESTVSTASSGRRNTRNHQTKENQEGIDLKSADRAQALFSQKERERKVSTGTLNRLILVAQALESEVDSRRQTDISGGKVVFSIRMANMILLILVNALLFSGLGQYFDPRNGGHKSLVLTPDKWYYNESDKEMPATFDQMRLTGQFLAGTFTVSMLCATVILQIIHLCKSPISRITSMCYSFGAVPFALFVFGLEMHYSACPWIADYHRQIMSNKFLGRNINDFAVESQCGINGWVLAGIFSLLSCGLFVSEGLIAAFFRSEANYESKLVEALL